VSYRLSIHFLLLSDHLFNMKNLALFDFDGTLTSKDTFLEMIKYARGDMRFWMGMLLLSPYLVAFKLKLMPNWRAKEIVISWFFKNEECRVFDEACTRFCTEKVPRLIKPEALEAFNRHKANGDRIVVVSASAENWVRPWCEAQGVECVATRLGTEKERLTGRLNGRNCYGPEKAVRIKEFLNLEEYATVFAYGDTSGDREMLALAHKPFFRKYA